FYSIGVGERCHDLVVHFLAIHGAAGHDDGCLGHRGGRDLAVVAHVRIGDVADHRSRVGETAILGGLGGDGGRDRRAGGHQTKGESDHAVGLAKGSLALCGGDEFQVGPERVGEGNAGGVRGPVIGHGQVVSDIVAFGAVGRSGLGQDQVGRLALVDDQAGGLGGVVGGVRIVGGAARRGCIGEIGAIAQVAGGGNYQGERVAVAGRHGSAGGLRDGVTRLGKVK